MRRERGRAPAPHTPHPPGHPPRTTARATRAVAFAVPARRAACRTRAIPVHAPVPARCGPACRVARAPRCVPRDARRRVPGPARRPVRGAWRRAGV